MPDMNWDFFKAATAIKDIVTAVGICAGGLWAYIRFILGRDKETALDIDLNYSTVAYGSDAWITFIDIILKNVGKVQLRAREKKPAYDHNYGVEHRHEYGFGLTLRRIPDNLAVNSWVDWFGDSTWGKTLPEVNLLKGYVKSVEDELQTDFWMEPGECYSFAAPHILAAGSYLALVTFVGISEKTDEFWQREFLIQVPSPNPATDAPPAVSHDHPVTG
ncbi:MAG TPA: hypothetical protein VMJ66_14895 [Geobacteraceae bacterium]|nr:hypothetical protein [Geobacteraceae bacterium]